MRMLARIIIGLFVLKTVVASPRFSRQADIDYSTYDEELENQDLYDYEGNTEESELVIGTLAPPDYTYAVQEASLEEEEEKKVEEGEENEIPMKPHLISQGSGDSGVLMGPNTQKEEELRLMPIDTLLISGDFGGSAGSGDSGFSGVSGASGSGGSGDLLGSGGSGESRDLFLGSGGSGDLLGSGGSGNLLGSGDLSGSGDFLGSGDFIGSGDLLGSGGSELSGDLDSGASGTSGDFLLESESSGDLFVSGFSGDLLGSASSGFSGVSGDSSESSEIEVTMLPTEGEELSLPSDTTIQELLGASGEFSGGSGTLGASGGSGASGDASGDASGEASGEISGEASGETSGEVPGEVSASGAYEASGASGDAEVSRASGEAEVSGASGEAEISGEAEVSGETEISGASGEAEVSGEDEVSGAPGEDEVSGVSGEDQVSGASGEDEVSGASGEDEVSGDSGSSVVDTEDTVVTVIPYIEEEEPFPTTSTPPKEVAGETEGSVGSGLSEPIEPEKPDDPDEPDEPIVDVTGMPTCLLCICLGTSVYCDDLNLDSVPPLPKETTHFYARYNRIKKINKSDFASMNKLKRIDVTANEIMLVDDNAFSGLPSLEELVIRENHISQLPALPVTMTLIDASHNTIGYRGLHKEAFKDMAGLLYLYLTDNRLDHIPVPLPESLRSLHLQRNNIQMMHEDTFCNLKDFNYIRNALEDIRLDGNPINLSRTPQAYICLPRIPIGDLI